MTEDLLRGADGRVRCGWCGNDSLYVAYHDDEWGYEVRDEQRVFEKLCLESFQAGLSWLTILRKRPAFRDAFAGFDPRAMAAFDDAQISALQQDPRIVRNRAKIIAAIANAQALLALHEQGESLSELVWSYAPDARRSARPRSLAELPSRTPESSALAGALKAGGFAFVGPTTCYALMQALGVVDDHLEGCWRNDSPGA